MRVESFAVSLVLLAWPAVIIVACSSESSGGTGTTSATGPLGGEGGTAGQGLGAGGSTASGGASTGGGGHAEGGAPPSVEESEPNDGASATDYNSVALGTIMHGAIDPAGDQDVFRLTVAPGTVAQAELRPADGSSLQGHMTVFDDGGASGTPADDYVKIARTGSGSTTLQWLSMGEGGYYIAVRDGRNVDGGSVGGPAFRYELHLTSVERSAVTVGPLPSPGPAAGQLAHAGAVALYDFDAAAWQNALIDLQATGDLDGRLMVFAASTLDWIARNDDRSGTDPDPLIDAPLSEGGSMVLVVENVAESATSLGYQLSSAIE